MKLIKSPLRYPGGKQKLVKQIHELIPNNFEEYREPFVGGGSFFLWLKQQKDIEKWWINDYFEPVQNFWNCMKIDPKILSDYVFELKSKANRELKLKLETEYASYNNIEKAAAYFTLNRISFSGLAFSGGYSQQSCDGRFKINHIQQINTTSKLLQDVTITHKDYKEVVQASGANVFIYLDPPYDIPSNNLYGIKGNMHLQFDHLEFAQICKNTDHKWLITYNDSDKIRDLFSFANIHEKNVRYSMNSNGKIKKELFITNY